MKHRITEKLKYPFTVIAGLFLLLIFMPAMKQPRTYTYLALGDSYTIGEKVDEQENFPHQVSHILRSQGITLREPKIIAKTGWTTDELQGAIQQQNIRDTYDFVTLLIGVNNQYRGREAAAYTAEFERLLQTAIGFTGGKSTHVIVLSIPDWGITPFATGRNRQQITHEIDRYNSINKEVSARYGVHYVDITPATRQAATDPGLLAEDGLHPSAREYAKWAALVAAIMQKSI